MFKVYSQSGRSSSLLLQTMAKGFGVKVISFDKGARALAFTREAALMHQLKQEYGVRFLPNQVIRRELAKGINPFNN